MANAASPGLSSWGPGPVSLPGSAGTSTAALLSGPSRSGRVLSSGRYAAYISISGLPGVALALCAADAVRMPFGIRLGTPAANSPLARLRPGDPVTAGRRVISAGALRVTVARWWATRPVIGQVTDADLAAWTVALRWARDEHGGAPGLGDDNAEVARLTAALARRDGPQAVAAAGHLIGLGPGSTPSGDDVVGSALAAMCVLAPSHPAAAALWLECGQPLAAAVTACAEAATTPVSSALLRCAARGEPTGEVADLLRSVAGAHGDQGPSRLTAVRLLLVGHTSGADCLQGIAAVAAALSASGSGHRRQAKGASGE